MSSATAVADAFAEAAAAMDDLSGIVVTAEGETRGQLQDAFDEVCNPTDWKRPWAAAVHICYVGRVMRAVEFFHADKARAVGAVSPTGLIKMMGAGYQA